jgi:hypothetical protein
MLLSLQELRFAKELFKLLLIFKLVINKNVFNNNLYASGIEESRICA